MDKPVTYSHQERDGLVFIIDRHEPVLLRHGTDILVPSNDTRASYDLQTAHDILSGIRRWHPIEASPSMFEIMLMGDSGYKTLSGKFVCNGYYDLSRGWMDCTSERLSDNGWVPTHWQPMIVMP